MMVKEIRTQYLPIRSSSEELVAVDNDNVCTAQGMAGKDLLELVQSSKNIIDADFDNENEMNKAAPVLASSEMRYNSKRISSYLDATFQW
ncbi:hypothetical protein TNCV_3633511 [Trichonephila clavipes]|nr:hypothetical protein TNCV_3633511 [Trichonephila clavipes]